jgi:hypothetical protein
MGFATRTFQRAQTTFSSEHTINIAAGAVPRPSGSGGQKYRARLLRVCESLEWSPSHGTGRLTGVRLAGLPDTYHTPADDPPRLSYHRGPEIAGMNLSDTVCLDVTRVPWATIAQQHLLVSEVQWSQLWAARPAPTACGDIIRQCLSAVGKFAAAGVCSGTS